MKTSTQSHLEHQEHAYISIIEMNVKNEAGENYKKKFVA